MTVHLLENRKFYNSEGSQEVPSRPWGKGKMGGRKQGDGQWAVLRMTQTITSLSVTMFRLNFYNCTEKSGL